MPIVVDKILGDVLDHDHTGDLDSRYVNVTGDTMTGDLVMSGANIDLGTGKLVGEGGTVGVYVDSAGNVGIGTTDPSQKLHVAGGSLQLDNNTGIYFKDSGGLARQVFLVNGADNVFFGASTLEDVIFNVGTLGEAVRIKGVTGNVGIGIDNPQAQLDIYEADSPKIYLTNTTGAMQIYTSGSNLVFKSSTDSGGVNFAQNSGTIFAYFYVGTKRFGMGGVPTATLTGVKNSSYDLLDLTNSSAGDLFKVTNAGRVGINRASPSGKFHVVGAANEVQGIFQANSTQTANILDIRNSAGTTLNYFDGDGMLQGSSGVFVKNSYFIMGGQGVGDMSISGFYDRNELQGADKRGTVTTTITGAGTISSEEPLFNAFSDYTNISGTDNTTTKIEFHIDLLTTQNHYGSTFWQPFVHYRLAMGGSVTWYNQITVEISADNVNWYKPSGGEWDTTDAESEQTITGMWMGGNANPSIPGNVYRYVRFTLEDRQETSGYASKDKVWIAQIGLRHYSAPMARQYLETGGGTMYDTLTMNDAVDIDLGTSTGTKIGTSTSQKIGFFNATPIVQPTEITDELTTITHTEPGTPDYAIQDLTTTTPYGFVTQDEGNTVLKVIANLQTRVDELETTLVDLGLLADAD